MLETKAWKTNRGCLQVATMIDFKHHRLEITSQTYCQTRAVLLGTDNDRMRDGTNMNSIRVFLFCEAVGTYLLPREITLPGPEEWCW